MAQGQIEAASAEQEMNGVETLLGFLIRAAVNGQFQLRDGAGLLIGKLTDASDAS